MSMQDPIADMLTRIRNAQHAKKRSVSMPASKMKVAIARVLQEEGYILDHRVEQAGAKSYLLIYLKYYKGRPVVDKITRVSRPGLRVYRSYQSLGLVKGFGVMILSTSRGIMADSQAKKLRVGGEILCEVA